jgi:hypothetical protein
VVKAAMADAADRRSAKLLGRMQRNGLRRSSAGGCGEEAVAAGGEATLVADAAAGSS